MPIIADYFTQRVYRHYNNKRKGDTSTASEAQDVKGVKKTRAKAVEAKRRSRPWYNKRTLSSCNRLKELLLYLFKTRKDNKRFYWVTLTTRQHITGKTDKQCLYDLKKYMQHRNNRYVCAVERQLNTGDIHFHIATENRKKFNINKEVKRWSKIVGVEPHPAMFDVKFIKNEDTLGHYIAAYIYKNLNSKEDSTTRYKKLCEVYEAMTRKGTISKFWPPHSSLFQCRTFTASVSLSQGLKQFRENTRIEIPDDYVRYCECEILDGKKFYEYIDTYNYDEVVYKKLKTIEWMLRRAGLAD